MTANTVSTTKAVSGCERHVAIFYLFSQNKENKTWFVCCQCRDHWARF